MTQIQTRIIQNFRKAADALRLIRASRDIRKKITAKSGKWDSVKIIREIRYAK